MQRLLTLLALAGCSAFLPRAPRIVRPQPKLRESAGDDFLESLFEEADQRVIDDTPDWPPRNYDAAPYAEHDYERAQDDDGSSVDVAAVDALLAERVQMKRRRLFDEADAIRDELQRVHGVSVWDRERVWRTGRGGGRNQRQRGPPRSLPACGHDYECGNSDSSQSGMAVDEIDAILAERLQCKFRRDFQRADALQEELFSMGVRVHDGLKLWRDDGGGFGDELGRNAKAGRQRNSRQDRATYTMDPDSDDVEDEDKEEIEKLVAQRLEAKFERDYATADQIREQLQNEYDVKVDDRKRKWMVGDAPFRGAPDLNAPYTRRGGGEVEDVAKVEELVEERADAKARRDYAAADAIRDQLNAMGISVDDRSREWRVADAPYARARGDSAPVDVDTVEGLVAERSQAKIAGEYDTADAIRDRLRNEFGVSVDDRVKEWVVDGRSAAAPAAPAPVVEDEPFVVVDAPTEEPAAAAEAAPASGQSEEELSALTVPALKDLCRAAGLKVGGKKAELVERIMRGE